MMDDRSVNSTLSKLLVLQEMETTKTNCYELDARRIVSELTGSSD